MPDPQQRDIVWVRFPYADLEHGKFRPAVIVSNTRYNREHADVIACAITSKLEKNGYSIVIEQKNIESGTMPLKSRIRADKIMTLEKNLIAAPFARLDGATFGALVAKITDLVARA